MSDSINHAFFSNLASSGSYSDSLPNQTKISSKKKESFKKGTTIYDEKLNLTRGDLGPIKDYLTNLCDWSIESEFAEGAYRINYLVSDKDIPAYEKIMSAEGFKHILTFYK